MHDLLIRFLEWVRSKQVYNSEGWRRLNFSIDAIKFARDNGDKSLTFAFTLIIIAFLGTCILCAKLLWMAFS